MLLSLLFAFIFFCASVSLHMGISRIIGNKRFMAYSLGLGALITVIFFVTQLNCYEFDFVSLYLFVVFWLAYLVCFINLLNSVTLKMLEIVATSEGKATNINDFDKYFTEDDSLEARLKAMELNKFIVRDGNFVRLLPHGELMADIGLLIRKIFSVKDVG